MSSTPTMGTITQALADLYAARPDDTRIKWEVYPLLLEGYPDDAHLYADLTTSGADTARAAQEWAQTLDAPLQITDSGERVVLTVRKTLPGGVRVFLREHVHRAHLQESQLPDPGPVLTKQMLDSPDSL